MIHRASGSASPSAARPRARGTPPAVPRAGGGCAWCPTPGGPSRRPRRSAWRRRRRPRERGGWSASPRWLSEHSSSTGRPSRRTRGPWGPEIRRIRLASPWSSICSSTSSTSPETVGRAPDGLAPLPPLPRACASRRTPARPRRSPGWRSTTRATRSAPARRRAAAAAASARSTRRMRLLPASESGAPEAIPAAIRTARSSSSARVDHVADQAHRAARARRPRCGGVEQLGGVGRAARLDEPAQPGVRVDQPELGGRHAQLGLGARPGGCRRSRASSSPPPMAWPFSAATTG